MLDNGILFFFHLLNIKGLFIHAEYDILYKNDGQLELDFTS